MALSVCGEVGGPNERYSYQPRSDFMFLSDQCPLVIIEVCSKSNETDRPRMLLQGWPPGTCVELDQTYRIAIICSHGDLRQQRVCRESIPRLPTRQDGYRGTNH